jgi:hypothetical protein
VVDKEVILLLVLYIDMETFLGEDSKYNFFASSSSSSSSSSTTTTTSTFWLKMISR